MPDVLTPQQRHRCMSQDYYLVYKLDNTRSKQYINIPSLARGKQTTSPWFATWSELMDKKE